MRFLLSPLSLLFYILISIRKLLYKMGLLKSSQFSVPVISVGNLIVGGAGKTPFSLAIADLLKKKHKKVAVVYRGYKRSSKEKVLKVNVLAEKASYFGDEAYMFSFLNPDIPVYVGKNRTQVIEELLKNEKEVDCILLDDAFQHLAVKRNLDILLLDASERYEDYRLMPMGKAREPFSSLKRAHLLVLSKSNMRSVDCDKVEKRLNEMGRNFDFSFSYEGKDVISLNNWQEKVWKKEDLSESKSIILMSGVARPKQILDTLSKIYPNTNIINKTFSDHHDFNEKDFSHVSDSVVVISEKDAIKIKDLKINKNNIYVLRAKLEWSTNKEEVYEKIIHALA